MSATFLAAARVRTEDGGGNGAVPAASDGARAALARAAQLITTAHTPEHPIGICPFAFPHAPSLVLFQTTRLVGCSCSQITLESHCHLSDLLDAPTPPPVDHVACAGPLARDGKAAGSVQPERGLVVLVDLKHESGRAVPALKISGRAVPAN